MNINQLKYVLEIAKCFSMREASDRLFISQPALSSSVRDLEEELGIIIFDRNNKGCSVTEAGREFISYAKEVVTQHEILEERYFSRNRYRERFSVSTQHYNFAINSFMEVVKKFNPPKYMFSIHETKTKEVLEHVKNLKSEIGIISYTKNNERIISKLIKQYGLEFIPLMQKDTYIYVWEGHPLATRELVSLKELAEYPYISFDQEDDSNLYLKEEALANYDFDKQVKSADRATSMEMIAVLGGYSIGSGMLAGDNVILKGLKSIKLVEDDPLTIGYIVRVDSKRSVYGQAYIRELEKYIE